MVFCDSQAPPECGQPWDGEKLPGGGFENSGLLLAQLVREMCLIGQSHG